MMRWGIVFAVGLAVALGAWIAVQYNWVPPFVAVWDARALQEFRLAAGAIAIISGAGISSQTPWQRLPRWLRFVPVNVGVFVPLLMFLGTADLSPAVPFADATGILLVYAGFGVGMAAVIGVSSGFGKPSPEEDTAVQRSPKKVTRYLFLALVATCVIGAVVLLTPRARDDIKLEPFETLKHADTQLTVGVSKGAWQDDAFGVIRIVDQGKTNSMVLEASEWNSLVVACNKAKPTPSAAWTLAAVVADTTPSDPARMELWAGPSVRLIIKSPHGPTVRFQLAPNEFEQFGLSLTRVQQKVHS
ncbi:hypothetical protein [Rhizomicrobium electricum]|uniref:Uncharacterized protein n=1 Tax=Rhizomicrobium electricum TaxID=480070 RepID=A0ABP3Q9H8_9PROT|nr:hypothetical protein [Rhizomicrobium electricum]NIJ50586.1 hypothetical protein [Rhizomicrobium electricum]